MLQQKVEEKGWKKNVAVAVIPHSNCRNFEKRFSRETDPWKNWRLLCEQLNFGAGKQQKLKNQLKSQG